ncbi:NAD(P)-binding protein [Neobacillus vireti]|uniref:NAD(P)-binding protein n=1 Tax=Neobacillus vireti TaxID=220686 RepID=UPI002FFD5D73
MNSNYPIMVKLEGKKAVVVGGGKVAERKVHGLLGSGAQVVVISPEATKELRKLADIGKINWQQKMFSEENLHGAFLIFAATDSMELNQTIKKSAGDHQLVTIADDPEGSDFHVPSQIQRGRLTISVSTGGASPTLARRIREQLDQQFDERYEEYLEFLFSARQKILKEVQDPVRKRNLLSAIVNEEFLNSQNREGEFLQIMRKK